ncbi:hypothetical protein XENOCAPTIV_019415 [Xenoophorus captivus]|uniref:Uncharacterized protein n=1 Tax=Xenoophorus captivus TaxID=1517983 RepID=A0ABV0SAE0_9TELE
MSRRPHNKVPTASALLRPMDYDPLKVKYQLDKTKDTQKFYYNKRASRPCPDLRPGDGGHHILATRGGPLESSLSSMVLQGLTLWTVKASCFVEMCNISAMLMERPIQPATF